MAEGFDYNPEHTKLIAQANGNIVKNVGNFLYNAMVKPAWDAVSLPMRTIEGKGPQSPEAMQEAARDAAMQIATFGMGISPLLKGPATSTGMFIGKKGAFTAYAKGEPSHVSNMLEAQDLARAGVDRNEIWKRTGWGQNQQGQWFGEIPDNEAKYNLTPVVMDLLKQGMTPDEIRNELKAHGYVVPRQDELFHHPELYQAYDHGGMPLTGDTKLSSLGQYHNGEISLGPGAMFNSGQGRSTMLHENVHGIQEAEKWPSGGNPGQMIQQPEFDQNYPHVAEYYQNVIAPAQAENRRIYSEALDKWNKVLSDPYLAASRAKQDLAATPEGKLFAKNYSDYQSMIKQASDDMYWRLQGEVEARNVQARANFTPEQRRDIPPWESQNTPGIMNRPTPWDKTIALSPQSGTTMPSAAIDAWHGTPHTFDPVEHNPFGEFRDDKIGSGEGAQVYSYGHYAAGNDKVADNYLSSNDSNQLIYKGKSMHSDEIGDIQNTAEHIGVSALYRTKGDAKAATENLQKDKESWHTPSPEEASEWLSARSGQTPTQAEIDNYLAEEKTYGDQHRADHQAAIDWVQANPDSVQVPQGNMLRVRIKPDEHELLNWDKPLTQQSPQVQEILKSKFPEHTLDNEGPLDNLQNYMIRNGQGVIGRRFANEVKGAVDTGASIPEAIEWARKNFSSPRFDAAAEAANKLDYSAYTQTGPKFKDGITGEDFYNTLADAKKEEYFNSPDSIGAIDYKIGEKLASKALDEAGIPGTMYADGNSRNLNDIHGGVLYKGDDMTGPKKAPNFSTANFSKHFDGETANTALDALRSLHRNGGDLPGLLVELNEDISRMEATGFTQSPAYRDTIKQRDWLNANQENISFAPPQPKTNNYVIYNPKNLTIMGRNGEELPVTPVDHDPFAAPGDAPSDTSGTGLHIDATDPKGEPND